MKYVRLLAKCECGSLVQPHSLWLTDNKGLCVTGMCFACGEVVSTLYSLSELYKSCPFPDVKKLNQAIGEAVDKIANQTNGDQNFLRQCGIGGEL